MRMVTKDTVATTIGLLILVTIVGTTLEYIFG